MARFVTVARVGQIAEGTGMAFAVGGRMVAVFNDGGKYRAIDDFCPHMGASLAGGHVENGIVTCPWHAWRFDVSDGTWCDNRRIKIDAFSVRVQGDEIQVGLPDSEEKAEDGKENSADAKKNSEDRIQNSEDRIQNSE